MPSSLAVNHSSAFILYTRPPVSVCGTGARKVIDSGFSWKSAYTHCRIARGLSVLSGSAPRMDLPVQGLPTPFNRLFRQAAALSLLRPRFSLSASDGIFTVSSFACALRLLLRPRLTLIRLALIRNPWSSGGRVSLPPYRYLYLHLLFRSLQQGSSLTFDANGMLPYRCALTHIPRLRQMTYARLLSTPDRSTSELLRTL